MTSALRSDIDNGRPVKVPPLADALNLSRNGLYLAVRRGEVASIKIGCAIRVPAREAARLLGISAEPVAA